MKKNVGKTDRIIRTILGLAVIAIGLYFRSAWGFLGLIPILTSASGRCGFYVPLKIDTTEKK